MHIYKQLLVLCSALLLSACGGTGKFIDQPQLSVVGATAPTVQPTQVVRQIFSETDLPYRISFCEADPVTKACPNENAKPSATGIGGIFLPLVMELRAIEVVELLRDNDNFTFKARLDSPVNQIPPACGTVEGVVDSPSPESATIKISNFYCNWAAIGNVVTNMTFSIDSIDLNTSIFTGYYKLSFYGTGNASGSGYYRAVVASIDETGKLQVD